MKTPSQEELLGYVLGALDAQELREIQQCIDEQPELEEQLLAIKSSLMPLDCLEAAGHRPGLARRTCEAVANWNTEDAQRRVEFMDQDNMIDWDVDGVSPETIEPVSKNVADSPPPALLQESHTPGRVSLPERGRLSPRSGRGGWKNVWHHTWSMTDALVGVCVVAILVSLMFPALNYARYSQRLAACQHNLSQVGRAFTQYGSMHEGAAVAIPMSGNLSTAGSFGPILKDAGLLEDAWLACAGVASEIPVVIPSCDQVLAAKTDSEREHYRQTMGGHFGYSMGYCSENQYVAPRVAGQSSVVLLADRPSSDQPGRQSLNHGKNGGQNCLFADGRVEFVRGHAWGGDALFENDYGFVAPAFSMSDNVIAPSHLSPAVALGIQTSEAPKP